MRNPFHSEIINKVNRSDHSTFKSGIQRRMTEHLHDLRHAFSDFVGFLKFYHKKHMCWPVLFHEVPHVLHTYFYDLH